MTVSRHVAGYKALRQQVPGLSAYRLLYRLIAWKALRLFKAQPVVRLHENTRMRIQARPGEHGIRAAIFLFREDYEPSVRSAIDRFVHPGALCFDIGANLGLWTLRMAERAGPSGRVFAFEPLAANVQALRENARLSNLTNVDVLPYALGEAERIATLYVPDDVGRSSLAPESAGDQAQPVRVRVLDDVWREQGNPTVALVKMDVEGAEPLVLMGGRSFFGAVRPVTCCEINPAKLRSMGFTPQCIFDCFRSWRYTVLAWSECARDLVPYESTVDPAQVRDVVFVPEP